MNIKSKAFLLATGVMLIVVDVLLLLSNDQPKPGRQSVPVEQEVLKIVQEMFDAPDQSCMMGSDGHASLLHVPVPENVEATRWISHYSTGILFPLRKQPAVHEMWWLTHLTTINKPGDPGWMDCLDIYTSQQY